MEVRLVTLMRKLGGFVALVLMMAAMAFAAPKAQTNTGDRPFPGVLRNARYVYVASYDGDQFNPNLLTEDRMAIGAVEESIQKWGKLMLVYRPSEADIIILVQSRPSEDVLAVYESGPADHVGTDYTSSRCCPWPTSHRSHHTCGGRHRRYHASDCARSS